MMRDELRKVFDPENTDPAGPPTIGTSAHDAWTALAMVDEIDRDLSSMENDYDGLRGTLAMFERLSEKERRKARRDPARRFLIGPRIVRGIDRIVFTRSGRVRAERLLPSGWRRMNCNLVEIIRAPSPSHHIAMSISSPARGEFDDLTEAECRRRLLRLDPAVSLVEPPVPSSGSYPFAGPRLVEFGRRLTEEGLDDESSDGYGPVAGADRLVARELLAISPALWPSVAVRATWPQSGEGDLEMSVRGGRESDSVPPSPELMLALRQMRARLVGDDVECTGCTVSIKRTAQSEWIVETRPGRGG